MAIETDTYGQKIAECYVENCLKYGVYFMASPTSGMQSSIERYWKYLYEKKPEMISEVVSPEIIATYELKVNGEQQQPVTFHNREELISGVSKVSKAIEHVVKNLLIFHPNETSHIMEVDYEHVLVVNDKGNFIELGSKGKQIWTSDGTLLVALKVIESESYKKSYVPPPAGSRLCIVL